MVLRPTQCFLIFLVFSIGIACRKTPQKSSAAGKKTETKKNKSKNATEKPAPLNAKGKTSIPLVDSLDLKIGQMVMIGIFGNTLLPTDSILKEIKANKVGGIVLFEKNINPVNSKETLKKLVSTLQNEAAIPLFISIDEEGGKVHRLKEKYGFPKMPSAAYLGKLDDPDSTRYYTRNLAGTMSELGINLNYAPCVDVAINKNNPVIAKIERSYSEDPAIVTKQALISIKTQHQYGVKTILKHFPGHGSSTADSHKGMADVTTTWQSSELIPYRKIIQMGQVDAIMTAHIVNCKLDTSCLPSTLSKTIVTGLLRDSLKYQGAVFSDDMQMYAISKFYGTENAVKLAINAGVDVLLFGNNVNPKDIISASQVHAIVKKLVLQGDVSRERIDASFKRIMKLKIKTVN
jgi:beta-N-acetylhexosaminidase